MADRWRFEVTGRTGNTYEVIFEIRDGEMVGTCSCAAALSGSRCWHRTALFDGDISHVALADLPVAAELTAVLPRTALFAAYQDLQRRDPPTKKPNRQAMARAAAFNRLLAGQEPALDGDDEDTADADDPREWVTLVVDVPDTGLRAGMCGYVWRRQDRGHGNGDSGTTLATQALLVRFKMPSLYDAEIWVKLTEVRTLSEGEKKATKAEIDRARNAERRRRKEQRQHATRMAADNSSLT